MSAMVRVVVARSVRRCSLVSALCHRLGQRLADAQSSGSRSARSAASRLRRCRWGELRSQARKRVPCRSRRHCPWGRDEAEAPMRQHRWRRGPASAAARRRHVAWAGQLTGGGAGALSRARARRHSGVARHRSGVAIRVGGQLCVLAWTWTRTPWGFFELGRAARGGALARGRGSREGGRGRLHAAGGTGSFCRVSASGRPGRWRAQCRRRAAVLDGCLLFGGQCQPEALDLRSDSGSNRLPLHRSLPEASGGGRQPWGGPGAFCRGAL